MSTVRVPAVDVLHEYYCRELKINPDSARRAARPSREDVAVYFGIDVSQLGYLYRDYIYVHEAALLRIQRGDVHVSQGEAVSVSQGEAVPAPQASMTSSTMPGTTGVQQALQTGPSSSSSANLKISITIQRREKVGPSYRYYDQNNALVACGQQHLSDLGIKDEAERTELSVLFQYLGKLFNQPRFGGQGPIHLHRWPTSQFPSAQSWHIPIEGCDNEGCGKHRELHWTR